MGLFDKVTASAKETLEKGRHSNCSKCGKQLSILDVTYLIKDGCICVDCLYKMGLYNSEETVEAIKNMTLDEMAELGADELKTREEKQKELAAVRAQEIAEKEAEHQRMLEKMKEEEGVLFYYEGVRGRKIKVFEDRVQIITSATLSSFITGNATDGEKTIFYADCVGVQFKEPGITLGYIQLETAGGSLMNNKSSNFFNENTFTYDSSVVTTAEMRQLADFIRNKVAECKRGVSHSAPQVAVETKDPVEEIKKYKELLDMGIISDEEFQLKKKELLGL